LSRPAFAKRLDTLGFAAGKENGQRARAGIALREVMVVESLSEARRSIATA